MSNRPIITVELAEKTGARKIKVCAFWESKHGYPGVYSAGNTGWGVYDKDKSTSVAIEKLVLADGRTIKLAEYWTNATHWRERENAGAQGGGQYNEPPIPFGNDSADDDDIPF